MSAKQYDLNERGEAQKKKGWFSWRHQTPAAHNEARECYLSAHGPRARRNRAAETDRGEVTLHPCGHKHGERSPGRCVVTA